MGFESWDSYSAGEDSANPGPIDNRPILKGAYRPLVKNAYQKIIFLISQPNPMLWVLKRTVSMRWFF